MYAAVEFVGKEVAIVPMSWLVGSTKCYWPNVKSEKALMKLVQNSVAPQNWKTNSIQKIFFVEEDYNYAEDKCKKLVCDSKNSTSTACDTEHLKLKSFNIDEEFTESSSDNGNSSDQFSSESITSSSSKSKKKRKASQSCNYDFNRILKKNGKSLPATPSCSRSHEDPNIGIDYAKVIISLLEDIKRTQDQNTKKIDNIYKLINANHNTTNLVAPNQLPCMPLKNAQDFLNMESYLENPENYAYLISRLAVIGGTDVRNSTMNILKFVLTDDLASHYNWAGRKRTGSIRTASEPKLSFKSTLLMPAISDSIKMAYSKLLPPDLNDQHIAKAVKDWLKLAPQRFSNKSNKKYDNL